MINIFEVLGKTIYDYKNNFFKVLLIGAAASLLYIEGFIPVLAFIMSAVQFSFFTAFLMFLSFLNFYTLIGMVIGILFLYYGFYGVYDYFLRISRDEISGKIIILKKNLNIKASIIFISLGLIIPILSFYHSISMTNLLVNIGINQQVSHNLLLFYPMFVTLVYSIIIFVLIDNPNQSILGITMIYISLFKLKDILSLFLLYILFSSLNYVVTLSRGSLYIIFIPYLLLVMTNYYNELYLRKRN